MKPKVIRKLYALALAFGMCSNMAAQNVRVEVEVDTTLAFQAIHNFAASDAWAAQFTGLWPDEKRKQMADWLFSRETDAQGSPRGIGLSAWRFNIGAGSAGQGEESGIKDPWRRAEGFMDEDGTYDWQRQAGQQWFLQAAKERGVGQFIAFVNSPPINMTKNKRAHSDDGSGANLRKRDYVRYARFLSDVIAHFKDSLGIAFDYVSPFNEPQWEWKGGQEGSPWNNDELARATRVIDSVFVRRKITSRIELTEAGAIDYLTGTKKKHHNRSDQIETFFSPSSPDCLGNLSTLAPKVAAHSYFTTWPVEKLKRERERIAEKLAKYPALEYWMSEYCILENNEEIKGKGRDLGMQTALYVARVIHADLTIAGASAWHWWLAMSPYDFKDGLIYVDKNTDDGAIYDSKLLWTLGNYSRFIRPGAKRVRAEYKGADAQDRLKDGLLVSAYKNPDKGLVVVIVNQGEGAIDLKLKGGAAGRTRQYLTDASHNLQKTFDGQVGDRGLSCPGKSVTTLVVGP